MVYDSEVMGWGVWKKRVEQYTGHRQINGWVVGELWREQEKHVGTKWPRGVSVMVIPWRECGIGDDHDYDYDQY